MSDTAWHISSDTLGAYLAGTSGHVTSASVETHLMACETCRDALAQRRPTSSPSAERADLVWERIEERIDRPRLPELPGARWARVTLASPALRGVAVTLALALALVPALVAAVNPRGGVTLLVALAPIAPLLGAALAFRPELDPAGTMSQATPLASGRLTIRRAAVVGAVSLVAGLVASPLVDLPLHMLAAWVLPGLALCTATGAAATLIDPARVATALGAVWLAVVVTWSLRSRDLPLTVAIEDLPTSTATTQVALTLTTAICAAIWWLRRDELPSWRRT